MGKMRRAVSLERVTVLFDGIAALPERVAALPDGMAVLAARILYALITLATVLKYT